MILGKKEIIDRVKNAKPGDPSVYVNMDAIEQLPEEYESTIVDIDYDIQKDFSNVGTKEKPSWYPTVFFMNNIANKRGIVGYGESIVETIYEDVNISLMEMCADPHIMKMKVGYIVKKQGAVMQEDGVLMPCSPRSGMYNAYQECCLLWTKEEMYTEGYTKENKYSNKYDTKWKRRNHFQTEMDKALGIADSTAWSKCVRQLTGMQTGYTTADLKEGKFYFSKIRRSKLAIKAESAARLSALSQGKQIDRKPQELLFGPTETPAPQNETEQIIDFPIEEEVKKEPDFKSKPKWQQYIELIDHYAKENIIPDDKLETVEGAYKWIDSNKENSEKKEKYWQRAVTILMELEKVIPDVGKMEHSIY